ncbi:1-acyl-sn-glycerol-3-phosphate acyltransferase [Caulobacter sp. UNC279MFTsu5.1]|uniref:1-acyl-sn-glycerol-3-phosphate acyltransferase n=1 Tax=Caulobacter sp. UNC279MFTsu5.1 TaxID=1502775 RepID=UPI0003736136|nr:1-acyl-sn-glycerol-3-phosphate acyltransferase [Caulobacter sp. UNC279MFTsu5.1]SFK44701.1 Putative hemolysin [Caulobacter sp. UNC279MFTsu5.1]
MSTSQAVDPARPHIIDTLIAERAPKLCGSPAWPLARGPLHALLSYGKARALAQAVAPMGGHEALAYVSDLLSLDVTVQGLDNLPAKGAALVVCNHPTGIADGVAVHDALKARRADLVFYANADAVRVCPRLDEALIPVEWVEAKRTLTHTRGVLERTRAALKAEQALVIFPAGRLATKVQGRLTDKPWQASAVSIARWSGAPIVPLHLTGPWSTLFHLFDGRFQELRDITLFHEMLNKRGRRFSLIVGRPIPAKALDPDAAMATGALKHFVERVLPANPDAVLR